MQNLVVTSTRKKGNFKFTEKIKSVTGKSKCCSRFDYTVAVAALAAVAENNRTLSIYIYINLKSLSQCCYKSSNISMMLNKKIII